MTETLSQRRAQFLERWILTNVALLLTVGMVTGRFAADGDNFVSTLLSGIWHIAVPGIFLVFLPVNALYLFCSAHIRFNQRWRGHRSFWIWMMIASELWAFAVLVSLLFPIG